MSGAEFLDALDAARAAAAPGPWAIRDDGVTVEIEGIDRESVRDKYGFREADAVLIVEAVNGLPKLTAALRAVLRQHERVGDDCMDCGGVKWPCPTVRAITAALGGES